MFLLFSLVLGEIVVRLTHAMSDIPQRTIDQYGIQKYYPDQEGYWKGGDHKWMINELGWSGQLPESYNNLIMVIGDSYIENFMNPNECHQAVFLKEHMKNYNFMEAGRSGVSFIEAMEISKKMDTLKPINSLIYINDNDFYESIVEIEKLNDITQLSLNNNAIVFGEMKAPGLKKILYNWKLLYYFYNRFPINSASEEINNHTQNSSDDVLIKHNNYVFKLIDYIVKNYNIKDKTLVFHPNSNKVFIQKCKSVGFNVIELDSSNDKDWSFEYDSHWTCYGHKRVAEQISKYLKSMQF